MKRHVCTHALSVATLFTAVTVSAGLLSPPPTAWAAPGGEQLLQPGSPHGLVFGPARVVRGPGAPQTYHVEVSPAGLQVSAEGLPFTVFGPDTYTRATGAPSTQMATFSVLNPDAPYVLRAVPRGSEVAGPIAPSRRPSGPPGSAVMGTISVNGVPIVTPNDFSRTTVIEKPVALRAVNTIAVQLRSAPGTMLVVEIIGLDGDMPTITATATPAPNGQGWNRSPVTVDFQCADRTSGIASCPAPVVVSAEGVKQAVTGTAVDNAGNSASASVIVNLDVTPPVITTALSPPPNPAGWNRADVTVTFDCGDQLSGVESCPAPVLVTGEGGNQQVLGEVRDRAGNAATALASVSLDKTPPTMTATADPAPNGQGWNRSPVTVDFQCADQTSGIASCPAPEVVDTEGVNHTVTGTVVDKAGNTAGTSVTVNLDLTPPGIAADLSPPPNPAGWNRADVTVTFDCVDQLSGIESCPIPVLVTGEGGNQQVLGEVRDRAGNPATTLASVSLDKTPPDVAVTEPTGAVEQSPAIILGTASDAGSGMGTVACAGTAAVWSAGEFTCTVAVPDGPNAIVVEARDLAGNIGTSTATFVANLAALELRYVDNLDAVYVGSWPAAGDPYYRPRGIPAGYFSLGDSTLVENSSSVFAMVAKELKPGALKGPDGYELVYRETVCIFGCTDVVKAYRPVPPPGYVCLGVLFRGYPLSSFDPGEMEPGPDDIRCVREDLTTAGIPGAKLATYYYGGQRTTWQSFPADGEGIYTGQVAWSDSGAEPQSGTLHAISTHAVRTPHLSTADIVDLIESFGPTIRFHPGEDYFPDDPRAVLDGSLLRWGTVQNEWDYGSHTLNVLGEVATSASTLMAAAAFAQSFNNPPDSSFRTWITIPDDLRAGNLERARVLVRARTWNTVFTEIQFWMHYPFNGPGKFHATFGALWDDHEQMTTCGRHYGDWEHVSVLFESGLPVSVYLSRHDLNVWITRKDFGFLWDRGVHPVFYAGRDSHAHYTAAGRIHYKRVVHKCSYVLACLDVDLEDYTGDGATLHTFDPSRYWFASSAIPGVAPSDPEPDWLQFPGRWGQYEQLIYTYIVPIGLGITYVYNQTEVGAGPSGPAMKGAWQKGDWCRFSNTCQ